MYIYVNHYGQGMGVSEQVYTNDPQGIASGHRGEWLLLYDAHVNLRHSIFAIVFTCLYAVGRG